jgi:hypothetical protein
VKRRYYFWVLIGFVVVGTFLVSFGSFALPPTDVSGKIVTVDDDCTSQNPIKVGSDAYESKYNICDAQCMAERGKGDSIGSVSMPSQYSWTSNYGTTFNASDVQTVNKYFPSNQNSPVTAQSVFSNQTNQSANSISIE